MADLIFEHPRLINIYDLFDHPDRPDLHPYVAMAEEFNASKVIDLGCGTGVLACRLAALGKEVIGVDPAAASLDVARQKLRGDRVRWIHGNGSMLKGLQADLITMTGNVAQVFVNDEEWISTLRACHDALSPDGTLVFEVRDPSKRAWETWIEDKSHQVIWVPGIGNIEKWGEVLSVHLPLVSFSQIFFFHEDGTTLKSDSTLRFRIKSEIIESLSSANLPVVEIRDAPDRPELEWVFVARRAAEI